MTPDDEMDTFPALAIAVDRSTALLFGLEWYGIAMFMLHLGPVIVTWRTPVFHRELREEQAARERFRRGEEWERA